MSTKIPFRIFAGVLFSLAAIAATAFACGWMGTSRSVRFSGYEHERDMGRLPGLPIFASEKEDNNEEELEAKADAVWDRAEEAEQDGKLTEARALLKEYIERTSVASGYSSPTAEQHRRNSANDRLDALSALDRGSKTTRVQAYLNARRLHDSNPTAEIETTLSQIGSDMNLGDNAAYLQAAQLYRHENFEEAANDFSAIARRYPQSEKREASLFMAAVAVMKTSRAYSPTSGDEAHLHEYGPNQELHPVEIDAAWHKAFDGFQRVMTQYPRGRYFDDARGWKAYLLLRKADRAGALAEYYRLLVNKKNEEAQAEAAFSLELVRHHATDEDLARVENELADEPQAALAYAYHNIYNYPLEPEYQPSEEVRDPSGNYDFEATRRRQEEQSKEWDKQSETLAQKRLKRIIAFSRRLIDRYRTLAIGSAFALRAAQASVEVGQNDDAAQFARHALQNRLADDERVNALWIFGVAEHRLKHFSSARESFEKLLRDYPNSDLTEGARAHLAMIAEDSGDLDGALQQYLALNYTVDAAYFIDVLMTPEQLATFIERHPDLPQLNDLTYGLGVRYLRANRWNDARTTFAKVRTVRSNQHVYWFGNCSDEGSKCIDPKEGETDEQARRIITTQIVMRDVQTANDLEALERRIDEANGDEAKAEAMYQLASYQYDASSLLFYNPIAWTEGRYWHLSYLALENSYRTTTEAQALFAYMQEHDTLARALKIYLEVVDRYPHTRAARDSLYTAAVCHERLGQYNDYWREIYGTGLHAGARYVTYTHVRAAYPSYQLPRGTFRWQASTRTVDGGPGWAPKPTPLPRPSRFERVKLLLENFISPIVLFWNETGRRGLSLLTILVAMGFTARIATQNRQLLRPKLLRVRTRHAQQAPREEPAAEMFWTDPRTELWERARWFLRKRLAEFLELAQDPGSRPVLARNIASHSFLAGLIVSLLWTLHFG